MKQLQQMKYDPKIFLHLYCLSPQQLILKNSKATNMDGLLYIPKV